MLRPAREIRARVPSGRCPQGHVGDPLGGSMSVSFAVYAARQTMPNALVFPRNGGDLDVIWLA